MFPIWFQTLIYVDSQIFDSLSWIWGITNIKYMLVRPSYASSLLSPRLTAPLILFVHKAIFVSLFPTNLISFYSYN